jgi:lipopolysaccharide export LptBFGC system permease protein LptF
MRVKCLAYPIAVIVMVLLVLALVPGNTQAAEKIVVKMVGTLPPSTT